MYPFPSDGWHQPDEGATRSAPHPRFSVHQAIRRPARPTAPERTASFSNASRHSWQLLPLPRDALRIALADSGPLGTIAAHSSPSERKPLGLRDRQLIQIYL